MRASFFFLHQLPPSNDDNDKYHDQVSTLPQQYLATPPLDPPRTTRNLAMDGRFTAPRNAPITPLELQNYPRPSHQLTDGPAPTYASAPARPERPAEPSPMSGYEDQPYGGYSMGDHDEDSFMNDHSKDEDDSESRPLSPSGDPLRAGSTLKFDAAATDRSRTAYRTEKNGYISPRARSRERRSILLGASGERSSPRAQSQDGLGNWSGPGKGASPYGPLGTANTSDQGHGYNAENGGRSANSSNPNLLFAEGDFITPQSNAFSRFVGRIYDSSFLVRWLIYIIPLLVILWIPGIVGLTAKKDTTIWSVPLVFWSIWLTVVWCGWWAAALVTRFLPTFLRNTIGIIAPGLAHYIAYVEALHFYIGATAWAVVNWISFLPLIRNNVVSTASSGTLNLITQALFGIFIVLIILLAEKLVIQVIAYNFHKKSYEDRIIESKFQIRVLVSLYLNSHDIGRVDTLDGAMDTNSPRPSNKRQMTDPSQLVKKALHGAKKAARTATTVIGTVASEIAGERVLQPNSPASMVQSALGSASKTKQLARRIYYSFTPSYRSAMLMEDIRGIFERSMLDRAFAIFDRDSNGDATLEEVETACLDIHRERLALSNSMRDIDSAVGRLDNILMSVYYVVSIIIIVGLLDASFNTFIAGAGTLVLGLSWLIGTTAQEILASIIFLFVKHVYDVGDRVDIDGVSYIVVEMHLLSTIFRRIDGMVVQAPHIVLNQKFVNNVRRSGAISETFTWDVNFATSFEKLEELREKMMEFLEAERRDFLPSIDITVQDFQGQGKLALQALINYRSNWQNGALKAQRRNKWTCALKLAMAELEIYGPANAGHPVPLTAVPIPYTQVPYSETYEEEREAARNVIREEFKHKKTHPTNVPDMFNKGDAVKVEIEKGDLLDEAVRDGTRRS